MAKSLLGALALASLPSALAFRNTSPYFLFSTADLNLPADNAALAHADNVVSQMMAALERCPTKTYFVVRKNSVSSADFADPSRSAPRLAGYLSGKTDYVKSTMVVPEVVEGTSGGSAVVDYLQRTCGVEHVVEVTFPDAAPTSQGLRDAQLGANDQELQQLISKHADSADFTVIYTSTPPIEALPDNHPPYQMEDPFSSAVQMELKRDLSAHKRAASKEGGLFERYQYFTPGLFMGLVAIVPLFAIVLVGVKALLSLEVSYFAFSKEMGPSAQRKQ